MNITEAATRYVRALDAERLTRLQRDPINCAHMAPIQDEEGMAPPRHPDGGSWQGDPCWRWIHAETVEGIGHLDGGHEGDLSDRGWCEPCKKRHELHAKLRQMTRARVGALASLRAAVRASEVPNGR